MYVLSVYVMCYAEHPIEAAKQILRQPDEKAQHTQWASDREQTGRRTKYSTNKQSLAPSHD